jgi:hypothetical protein
MPVRMSVRAPRCRSRTLSAVEKKPECFGFRTK